MTITSQCCITFYVKMYLTYFRHNVAVLEHIMLDSGQLVLEGYRAASTESTSVKFYIKCPLIYVYIKDKVTSYHGHTSWYKNIVESKHYMLSRHKKISQQTHNVTIYVGKHSKALHNLNIQRQGEIEKRVKIKLEEG